MSRIILSKLPGVTGDKKTEQIGFKVTPELFEALERAAATDHRPRNQLARLIFEWAFERYRDAGSYHDLIAGQLPEKKRRQA
ncbi:MAG: hypothetical protein ACRD4R_06875 [Candidatus Acidiferrales bacterium]